MVKEGPDSTANLHGSVNVRSYNHRNPPEEGDEADPYPGHEIDVKAGVHVFSIPVRIPDSEFGLYTRVYYVRAYPVINAGCKMQDGIEICGEIKLNAAGGIDLLGKVTSDVYPLRKWATIADCSSEQNYLETRDEEDAVDGVNTDNRDMETWRCELRPRGVRRRSRVALAYNGCKVWVLEGTLNQMPATTLFEQVKLSTIDNHAAWTGK